MCHVSRVVDDIPFSRSRSKTQKLNLKPSNALQLRQHLLACSLSNIKTSVTTMGESTAATSMNTGGDVNVVGDAPSIEQLQDELDALNANITKVGSRIRELKKNNANTSGDTAAMDELTAMIQSLQELKLQAVKKAECIAQVANTSTTTSNSFQRKVFDELMIRKMYIIPSFEIHGGVKGLFDLGPPACSLKVGCLFSIEEVLLWYQ